MKHGGMGGLWMGACRGACQVLCLSLSASVNLTWPDSHLLLVINPTKCGQCTTSQLSIKEGT